MTRSVLVALAIAVALYALADGTTSGGTKLDTARQAKLNALLKGLKKKAESTPTSATHDVDLPVATAGVRAGQAPVDGSRFAVIWPGRPISPLTALAENLQYDVGEGRSAGRLKQDVDEFRRTFPEFEDESLIKDVSGLLGES